MTLWARVVHWWTTRKPFIAKWDGQGEPLMNWKRRAWKR